MAEAIPAVRRFLSFLALPFFTLGRRIYPVARFLHIRNERLKLKRSGCGPLLVLQMGKVGSRSVEAGLKSLQLPMPIYHPHVLSADRVRQLESDRRRFFRTRRHAYLARPWTSQFLLNAWQTRKPDRSWTLVSMTREPIARNVSGFFQNLQVETTSQKGRYRVRSDDYDFEPMEVDLSDTSKLAAAFLDKARHDSALTFFDREVRDIFGIDVLAEGFPLESGYGIYEADRVRLLVMRMEDLNQCAKQAFQAFLGVEDFQLPSANVAADKVYAPLYDAFRQQLSLSPDYVDRLLEARYTRTFYSAGEIQAARERWLGPNFARGNA